MEKHLRGEKHLREALRERERERDSRKGKTKDNPW